MHGGGGGGDDRSAHGDDNGCGDDWMVFGGLDLVDWFDGLDG